MNCAACLLHDVLEPATYQVDGTLLCQQHARDAMSQAQERPVGPPSRRRQYSPPTRSVPLSEDLPISMGADRVVPAQPDERPEPSGRIRDGA
jgi:hypothetical protein